MKRLIISLTIVSFLNLIGCYYQEQMKPADYSFDESNIIKVTTKDTVYNLNGKDISLVNDTLFGKVSKKIDKSNVITFNLVIPVEDIEVVEVERSDTALLILLGLGIVVGVFVLAFLLTTNFGQSIY